MQRDSLASHIGHFSRLSYMALADNETTARMKYKFLMRMCRPCGPPIAEKEKGKKF